MQKLECSFMPVDGRVCTQQAWEFSSWCKNEFSQTVRKLMQRSMSLNDFWVNVMFTASSQIQKNNGICFLKKCEKCKPKKQPGKKNKTNQKAKKNKKKCKNSKKMHQKKQKQRQKEHIRSKTSNLNLYLVAKANSWPHANKYSNYQQQARRTWNKNLFLLF